MSLARRESRARSIVSTCGSPRNGNWRRTVVSSARKNMKVFEARSMQSVVIRRDALIIFSDNFAPFADALQRTLNNFFIAFQSCVECCVWYQGRCCLIVQVDSVRVELFRQGNALH